MKQLIVISTLAALLLIWMSGSALASDAKAMTVGLIIAAMMPAIWSALADARSDARTPQPRPQVRPIQCVQVLHVQLPPPPPAATAIIVGDTDLAAWHAARQQLPALPAPPTVPGIDGDGDGDARIWRTTADVPAGWLDEY